MSEVWYSSIVTEKKPKPIYHIRNWKHYNKALVKRGSLTIWVEQKALHAWLTCSPSAGRGCPHKYADVAIEALLVLREVFHLPLRNTQGFVYDNARTRKNMKKILVIGSGGAGKSTFAKRLGKILNLEVIHLDSLYWNPGWIETPKQEWKKTVEHIITRDSWIMDGNYSGTLDLRFEACDTVVFLDIARMICLWRVIKRAVEYRNKSRPDMAEGCPERFDIEFIHWVWNYRKRTRPKIVRLLKERAHNKKVIWVRSAAEVEKILAEMKDA